MEEFLNTSPCMEKLQPSFYRSRSTKSYYVQNPSYPLRYKCPLLTMRMIFLKEVKIREETLSYEVFARHVGYFRIQKKRMGLTKKIRESRETWCLDTKTRAPISRVNQID